VRVKMAMSLDGRTAMASGESKWITGEASRVDVQHLRAQSSAVLTGIGTVLADDPSMNVRLTAEELGIEKKLLRQPKRIVLDSQLQMPSKAKIFSVEGDSAGGECIVYTAAETDIDSERPYSVEDINAKDGKLDLHQVMKDLADKQVNLVHVEAGSVLCGALLKNDLVDEIILYMAPHIIGDAAKGLFHLPGLEEMKDRIELEIKDVRSIGRDIRITAKPV